MDVPVDYAGVIACVDGRLNSPLLEGGGGWQGGGVLVAVSAQAAAVNSERLAAGRTAVARLVSECMASLQLGSGRQRY